jgi:hypothetical protein
MKAIFKCVFALVALAAPCFAQAPRGEKGVRVVPNEAARRVDVFIDGEPFTSYVWPESLKRPVLYPLRAPNGADVTRGYPLDPRPGERVDHPHHAGLWFSYGNVNGVDFWNNSTTVKPEAQAKMGTTAHRRVVSAKGGGESGELVVEADWVMPDGKTILRETTTFVFHAGRGVRAVDRVTTLTAAQDARVAFRDDKEGMLGLRVRRELEHPSDRPEVFTDASGRPTEVPRLDNTGVNGQYLTSEGRKGEGAWGTRARWAALAGQVGGGTLTVAILDHPKNVGHPTYWHARGYGLFAANPLGQEVFSNGKERLNFALEPAQSVTFRHRLLLFSRAVTPAQLEAQYKHFAEGQKPSGQ